MKATIRAYDSDLGKNTFHEVTLPIKPSRSDRDDDFSLAYNDVEMIVKGMRLVANEDDIIEIVSIDLSSRYRL
jgi:hypothetical protein